MNEKLKFRTEEVISYLEDLIDMGIATQEEINWYEDVKWFGKVRKFNNTYRDLIIKMRKEWDREF